MDIGGTWEKVAGLRYGENPHQPAALYRTSGTTRGLAGAQQLHGKEMSYNNYVDADAARRSAADFDTPAVAVIKHANPCGIAVGTDIAEAHRKAHACDPTSAFGGVIAANRPVSVEMARQVAEIFTEVIIAPEYDARAVDVLAAKKNLRILVVEPPALGAREQGALTVGSWSNSPIMSTPPTRPGRQLAAGRRSAGLRPHFGGSRVRLEGGALDVPRIVMLHGIPDEKNAWPRTC